MGLRCGEVMEAVVTEDDKEEYKANSMMDRSMMNKRPLLAFKFYS